MLKRLLLVVLSLIVVTAHAQFTPGQILTAAQLNGAFSNVLPVSGGTLTGPLTVPSLSVTGAPIPLASGGTGANTATGALAALGAAPIISANMTLNVPSQYATIQAALNYLGGFTIASGVAVTIQVADGTYNVPSPITLNHPNGNNIHIIGDVATPANCVLQFASFNGFYVPSGFALGEINGFYIKNTGTKAGTLGIFSDGGALSKVGPNLTIDGFYYGLAARNRALINASGSPSAGITVKNGGDVNIWAYQGGQINAQYATSTGAIDATNNYGAGFLSEFGGVIDATNAVASGNYLLGIGAYSGGSVRAQSSVVSGNGGATPGVAGYSAGYVATGGGSLEVFNGSTTGNVTNSYGYSNDSTSSIAGASTLTNSGNALGNFFIPTQFVSGVTTQFNNGSVTVNATYAGNLTSGATYIDQNIPASNFAITRFLTAGSEIWRQQYSNGGNSYTWTKSGGGTGLTYSPATGNLSVSGTGTMPLYSTTGTAVNAPHKVTGSVALVSGTATVTLSGSAVFTSSTSYVCTANDTTAAAAVKVGQTSGTSITFTGTSADTVQFSCAGN